ncbi:MAG: hypothetical protein AAF607_09665 [Pseudomonadota bacterium]
MRSVFMLSATCFGLIVNAAVSLAAIISPTSYNIPNGSTGSFTYFDDSYNGAGGNNVPGAALTGGVGDLTDGVIAVTSWNGPDGPNPGPYVGWLNINPKLSFFFD